MSGLAAARSAESLSADVAASATTLESGKEAVTAKAAPSWRRSAVISDYFQASSNPHEFTVLIKYRAKLTTRMN